MQKSIERMSEMLIKVNNRSRISMERLLATPIWRGIAKQENVKQAIADPANDETSNKNDTV
jgi:hypothetical protein